MRDMLFIFAQHSRIYERIIYGYLRSTIRSTDSSTQILRTYLKWLIFSLKLTKFWTSGDTPLWIVDELIPRGCLLRGYFASLYFVVWNYGFVDLWISGCGFVDLWICGSVDLCFVCLSLGGVWINFLEFSTFFAKLSRFGCQSEFFKLYCTYVFLVIFAIQPHIISFGSIPDIFYLSLEIIVWIPVVPCL